MISLTTGVVFLHGKNIVHKDLKPENILIDDKDRCIICDFGISETNITEPTLLKFEGTIAYMSPESLRQ